MTSGRRRFIPCGATASPTAFYGQRVLIANTDTFNRNMTGWTTRANFGFDFASNTAYGPLIGHFDINAENGNGFDNTGNADLHQHRLHDLGGNHRR